MNAIPSVHIAGSKAMGGAERWFLRVLKALAEAGYRSATTCVRAPARPGDDPLAPPRKAISFGDDLAGVAWKMHLKNTPKGPWPRRHA